MNRASTRALLLAGALLTIPMMAWGQAVPDPTPPQDFGPVDPFSSGTFGMRGLPLIFVLSLVLIGVVYSSLRQKRQNELMARFIDKGEPIPPQLLPKQSSRRTAQRIGVFLIAFGLALGLVIYVATGALQPAAAWSMMPLFLGAASFINARFFYPDSRG